MPKKKNRKIIINLALSIVVVLSFYLLSRDIQKQKKTLEIHELKIESQMKLILHHDSNFRHFEKYLRTGQI